ncbi:MAG: lysostaphin resistance A-like protein [Candidatus Hodarchaeota archaeon]
MSESKLKTIFSVSFYFVICATFIYNLQYIVEVILIEDADWDPINVTAVKFAVIGLTGFFFTYFFIKWQQIDLKSLGLDLERKKITTYVVFGAFLGMLALLSTAFIEIAGEAIGAEVAKERADKLAISEVALLVAFQLLFVGPGEELIFRGYIQGETEKVLGPLKAILLSACAFGLIHVLFYLSINPESVVIIFVSSAIAGLGFGYARYVSGNLSYPIAIHGFWNALAFILQIEYVWGYDPKAVGFMEFVVETLATTLGIGLIVIITYWLARFTPIFDEARVNSQGFEPANT